MQVERVQTGVRLKKRMQKVLKGLAAHLDMSMGDLLEGIVLASFEGTGPFSEPTLVQIEQLKAVYEMDYGAEASHRMVEVDSDDGAGS